MKKNQTNDAPAPTVAWLFFDACAFGWLTYKSVEYVLLRVDGVVGPGACAAALAGAAAATAAMRFAWVRRRGGRFFPGLILEWGTIVAVCAALGRLSLVQFKGEEYSASYSWVPLEWHKLLDNHLLLARVTPSFAFALLALMAGGVWLFLKKKRAVLIVALAALTGVTVHQCRIMDKEGVFFGRFIMYGTPLLVALAAALMRQPRMGSRALAFSAGSLILIWHYVGWVPIVRDDGFASMPGVSRVYPKPGEKAAFPLAFLRDFQVDPEEKHLFTAYGPSSGIVRLDIGAGTVEQIVTHEELVRYLALDPPANRFYALDWIHSDLLTLSMNPLRRMERKNLFFEDKGLYVPLFFILDGGKMYVTYTERPGIAQFNMKPLRLERSVNFRDLGLTKFRSGVWKAAFDPQTRKLYAEIGMTGLDDRFTVARIDVDSFQLDGQAEMPEGGLELIALPDRRRLIAASFFSDKLYEFDMDSMRPTRVMRGPLSCRNLVYDPSRGLLYGTAFLSGELLVMDWETGDVLMRKKVGNKASSLYVAPDGKSLYVGSSWGIFRVELGAFLEGAPRRRAVR